MYNTFLDHLELAWVPRTVLRPGHVSPAHHRPRTRPATEPAPPALPAIPDSAEAFARDLLQFPLDSVQAAILAGPPAQSRRTIVNCSRQWGKSRTGAAKALHHGLTRPRSLVLIASRTRHQAAELLDKAIDFARSLDLPLRRVPGQPASLLLPNGSRLIAISGRAGSVRAYSAVSLLIIDEAAFVPDSLYEACRPMLATTNGEIWLLSTPNGPKGFFYREWSDQQPLWRKFTVPADQCPRIAADFLAEERRKLGPAAFDREYMCKFGSAEDNYFDTAALEASVVETAGASQNTSGVSYASTRFYVGFDLGQKSSHSGIVVLERAVVTSQERDPVTFAWLRRNQIHLRRAERLPLHLSYQAIADRLVSAIKALPNPKDVTLILDATGCGSPFLDILRRHPLGVTWMPVVITATGRPSMSNSMHRVAKSDLMSSLNYVITAPDFRINAPADEYQAVMRELEQVRTRTSATGATRFTSTAHDDLVMAFSLAAWPARKFLGETVPHGAGGLPPLW